MTAAAGQTTQVLAARRLLGGVRRLAVLTGAGMSADSGIPTFREAKSGLWSRFDPMQLASRAGFCSDPALVWRWYQQRRAQIISAMPHAGYLALAQAEAGFERLVVVTQNVDGLHSRAGSSDVLELHGNILVSRCLSECGVRYEHPDDLPAAASGPPTCPSCGALLRPAVVWFGEMLDPDTLARAEHIVEASEAMLVIGTSGLVYPAAGLPALARANASRIIVINPDHSELDDLADIVIRERAAAALVSLFTGRAN